MSISFKCESWEEKKAKADHERKKIEKAEEQEGNNNLEYGIYVELFIQPFFVSEKCIPKRAHIYEKGKKKYDLSGLNMHELIISEIFTKKHDTDIQTKHEIKDIQPRLYALYNILNYDIPILTKIEIYTYKTALLGAVGSLIAALETHPIYKDVINNQFKAKLRNVIFHINTAILRQHFDNLKLLFSHIYDHCRQELISSHSFPILPYPLIAEDRMSNKFKQLIENIIETHKVLCESENFYISELPNLKIYLNAIFEYFNNQPALHSQGKYPKQTAIAIRGNAIGYHLGRISGATMAISKNRAFNTDDFKGTPYGTHSLTLEQRRTIQNEYNQYIFAGNKFRHAEILYSDLLRKYKVKTIFKPIPPSFANPPQSNISLKITQDNSPLIKDNDVLQCIRDYRKDIDLDSLTLYLTQGINANLKQQVLRRILSKKHENQLQGLKLLIENGIELNYAKPDELPLSFEPFWHEKPKNEEHSISLLDLLFNVGNADINATAFSEWTLVSRLCANEHFKAAEWVLNHPKSDLKPNGIHAITLKYLNEIIQSRLASESHILLKQRIEREMGINQKQVISFNETETSIAPILYGFNQLKLEDKFSLLFNTNATLQDPISSVSDNSCRPKIT